MKCELCGNDVENINTYLGQCVNCIDSVISIAYQEQYLYRKSFDKKNKPMLMLLLIYRLFYCFFYFLARPYTVFCKRSVSDELLKTVTILKKTNDNLIKESIQSAKLASEYKASIESIEGEMSELRRLLDLKRDECIRLDDDIKTLIHNHKLENKILEELSADKILKILESNEIYMQEIVNRVSRAHNEIDQYISKSKQLNRDMDSYITIYKRLKDKLESTKSESLVPFSSDLLFQSTDKQKIKRLKKHLLNIFHPDKLEKLDDDVKRLKWISKLYTDISAKITSANK